MEESNPRIRIRIALAVAAAAGWVGHTLVGDYWRPNGQVPTAGPGITATQSGVFGSTTITEFASEGRKAMEGKTKLLAGTVRRNFALVQTIEESLLGIKSSGMVLVEYTVEFPLGFDLRPDSYMVEATPKGLAVTVLRPALIAAPAVTKVTHRIASTGVLVDEKNAVIEIQQRLSAIARETHAASVLADPAVEALCERSLRAFLLDFLNRKLPNATIVPNIEIRYR